MDRPYCSDCVWLAYTAPCYWCELKGIRVGRSPRTLEACEDFALRPARGGPLPAARQDRPAGSAL